MVKAYHRDSTENVPRTAPRGVAAARSGRGTIMTRRIIATLAAASMVGGGIAPAYAKTPGSLSDLVGARAPGAESEMQNRGYKMENFKGGGQYWWNGDSDTCVRVVVSQGRYSSVDKTDASDCGKGGGNAAAAVGAIAAVGLIAALASHKKKHDDGNVDHDREYSRGYNDGLYGGQYDRNDSEGYHEGFMAGEAEASNRRAANRSYARGGTDAGRSACERRADEYQNAPWGSSVVVSQRDKRGNHVYTVATGSYRSICTADLSGRVIDIQPYY